MDDTENRLPGDDDLSPGGEEVRPVLRRTVAGILAGLAAFGVAGVLAAGCFAIVAGVALTLLLAFTRGGSRSSVDALVALLLASAVLASTLAAPFAGPLAAPLVAQEVGSCVVTLRRAEGLGEVRFGPARDAELAEGIHRLALESRPDAEAPPLDPLTAVQVEVWGIGCPFNTRLTVGPDTVVLAGEEVLRADRGDLYALAQAALERAGTVTASKIAPADVLDLAACGLELSLPGDGDTPPRRQRLAAAAAQDLAPWLADLPAADPVDDPRTPAPTLAVVPACPGHDGDLPPYRLRLAQDRVTLIAPDGRHQSWQDRDGLAEHVEGLWERAGGG